MFNNRQYSTVRAHVSDSTRTSTHVQKGFYTFYPQYVFHTIIITIIIIIINMFTGKVFAHPCHHTRSHLVLAHHIQSLRFDKSRCAKNYTLSDYGGSLSELILQSVQVNFFCFLCASETPIRANMLNGNGWLEHNY